MQHRTHDRLVAVGFTLVYVSAMGAMVLGEASAFHDLRATVLTFGCAPGFAVGTLLLTLAHLAPISTDSSPLG